MIDCPKSIQSRRSITWLIIVSFRCSVNHDLETWETSWTQLREQEWTWSTWNRASQEQTAAPAADRMSQPRITLHRWAARRAQPWSARPCTMVRRRESGRMAGALTAGESPAERLAAQSNPSPRCAGRLDRPLGRPDDQGIAPQALDHTGRRQRPLERPARAGPAVGRPDSGRSAH
jgi:hypothetical protein